MTDPAPATREETPTLPPTVVPDAEKALPDEAVQTLAPTGEYVSQGTQESMLPPPPESRPQIPGYEILGVLGRGGMGIVYKARQEKVNRLVALKMVLSGPLVAPEERLRFLIEGELLGRLQHPNVVQIYEVKTHAGQPYFALEFVVGGTLAGYLQKQTVSPRQAAELTETLAHAMHYAHSNGIVHRDLKPANVLLTPDRIPKITDFGLAKQMAVGTGLTASGMVMGTPSYMAPEQAEGKAITPQTDVYALGAILYEMLTGNPPFAAATPMDILIQVVTEEPPEIRSGHKQIPADLATICHKCLQKDPAKRYATAEALAADLRRFLEDRPILARPVTTTERFWRWCRRNPTVAGLVSAVFLSLVVGTTVAILFALEAQRERNATRRLSSLQAVHQGFRLAMQGDLFTALLWFAEPMLREPDDIEMATVTRGRIAAYRHFVPVPTLCHVLAHKGTLSRAVFSPDGRWVITASADKSARVWNAMTGEPRTPPLAHQDSVTHVAFSPDSRWVITTSRDGSARVWDAATGQPRTPLLEHPAPILLGGKKGVESVHFASFSPDGRWVITASETHARVWDATSGRPRTARLRHPRGVALCHAAFSPDGRWIATSSNFEVLVWDMVTGRARTHISAHHGSVGTVEFSPNGRSILTASADKTARVWDAATGQPITPVLNHQRWVTHATFSPDGHWVVTASGDNTARVWNANTGQPRTPPMNHQGLVCRVSFSSDSRWLVTASEDRTARVWDAVTGSPLTPPLVHYDWVTRAEFSPDSRFVVTTSGVEARLWDIATKKPLPTQEGQHNWRNRDAFSPDGRYLVSRNDDDNTARVWDTATGQPRTPPLTHQEMVRQATFSPDGRWVATASNDGTARVWDATTGQPRTPPLTHQDVVWHAMFSPNSQWLITASGDNTARIWDVTTGQQRIPPLLHREGVKHAAFSSDGRWVVTSSYDQTARVWDSATGQPRTPAMVHLGLVHEASFSPDSRWVITASDDGTARVWDAATGQPRTPPLTHQAEVWKAWFSADGRGIYTVLQDKKSTVNFWWLPEEKRPQEDLILLMQFLSAHRVDDTGWLTPLSSDEFQQAWKKLRAKYPDDFRVAPTVARQWRQEQIEDCMKSGNLAGAFLHRDWMVVEAIREQGQAGR